MVKVGLGLDVEAEIQILKVIYWLSFLTHVQKGFGSPQKYLDQFKIVLDQSKDQAYLIKEEDLNSEQIWIWFSTEEKRNSLRLVDL